eukprot:COSAG01_NODE_27007_length_697_cov_0.836120_1_plen_57_part_10
MFFFCGTCVRACVRLCVFAPDEAEAARLALVASLEIAVIDDLGIDHLAKLGEGAPKI